ncbi:MAG: disulfide oxidoreductase YuzD, partial [Planctomycetaceae bacterium]
RGDLDVEAEESLFLNLDNPVNGLLDDDQAIGTIANDDTVPTLAISNVSKVEGGPGQRTQFVFDVVLTGFSSNPVTVDFASADGTASAAARDYSSVDGLLTFQPGESLKQVVVNVAGDSAVETDEFFFVNLSNAVGADLVANQGRGTIENDDAAVPVLRIEDFSADEGIAGARTQFTFDVTLTASSNQILTVDYSTAAGTATSNVDFVSQDKTLTFFPGETTHTITVSVLGDTAFESLETFFVNLSNPQGLQLADDQAIGRIFNDDSPTPILSVSDGQVDEGIAGEKPSVTFNLRLSSPPAEQITVDFATADGTAESSNLDYLATNGAVTFLPGQQTASVTVTVLGDANVETNETFFLNLGDLTGNAVFENDQGTATIRNDDFLRPLVTITDAIKEEGVDSQRTRFIFDVSLSTPASDTTGPVEVQYQTSNGSAIGAVGGVFDEDGVQLINPNADYELKSGTLTFLPGEQTKQIVVVVLGDSRVEADETFFVNLTSSGPNAEIADDQALAIARNDDFPLPGVRVTNATVVEGTTEQRTVVDIELALSAPSETSIFVDFRTADGSATLLDQDYESTNGTVEFMPSEIITTVRLVVLGDVDEEADDTFFLNLTDISANAFLINDQAAITISNDDLLQVEPDITISDVTLREGDNLALPEYQFVVTLSGASDSSVTVDYSTAQGTANSADFVNKSGTLTFEPGETTKTVDVEVIGDVTVESDEAFFVDLTNAQGANIADPQGTGTIINDDVAIRPGIRINDVSQVEGSPDDFATEFTFIVELTGVFDQLVEVNYFSTQFSASSEPADRDFFRVGNLRDTDTISRLVFEPGETIQTITVFVVGDTEVEPNEVFFVNLFNPINAEIEDDQGIGFIINDDQALPQAEISDAIALEGDSGRTTFTFTITLDREADAAAAVDFSTANGTTGTSGGADVQTASGTVTFEPGEIQKTIEIDVVGDLTDEADEQFFVNLTNASGLLITDDQGRGIILNDDDPNAILAVTDAVNLTDEFGQEGNTGDTIYEFTVQLIGKSAGPVTVQVSTQDGSAIAGQDYDPVSQQLTFNAGETTKKVQVTVSGDQTVETDEFFFLNLSNPVGATIFDDQGIAAIINDDEVVNRDEGLELAQDVEAQVEAALADPTLDSTVPGDGIRVVKGTNSGGRSDITDLLVQIGLDVIERLGLTDAIVAVFDPVNFIVTTPEGRANGFTESSGVVGQSTNSFYSGDGAVELLVIPNASAGIYNLEVAGVNNGQFRAAVSRVDSSGQIGTETIEGTLAGELQLALDFTRAFPNDPGRNAEAEAAFLALFQEFGGDSDAIDLALAAFTNAPKSNADQEQISNQNDAAAQLQAAAAAVVAQAKLLATALQGALPDWASSGLAGAFSESDVTARGIETGSESSSAMRDFFWESVGRGVLGLPGGVTAVMDLLDPLMPEAEETETAADEDGKDKENDGTPADGEEGSKQKRADKPEDEDERRQAFLRQRDEDEVALYVPATAFVGPDWLAKAEAAAAAAAAAAAKSKSDPTPKNAGQTKSRQQNSERNADQSQATENASDSQQNSDSDDASE